MTKTLQTSTCYPFNPEGALCPLLNNAELLAMFYAEENLRRGIKQFCKKNNWPGKPTISFAINPEQLQALLLSLFNTPIARASLKRQSDADRVVYLDNAIWQWLTVTQPKLAERVSGSCEEIKDKIFLKPDALQQLLAAVQTEKPDDGAITALAYIVLAFSMLQPDDRYRFGESFLSAFPDFVDHFCGA